MGMECFWEVPWWTGYPPWKWQKCEIHEHICMWQKSETKNRSLKYIWICTLCIDSSFLSCVSHCMTRIWLLFLGTSDWKDLQDSITHKKTTLDSQTQSNWQKMKDKFKFPRKLQFFWRRLISKQNGLMIQELCAFLPTKTSQKDKRVSMVFQAFCAAFKPLWHGCPMGIHGITSRWFGIWIADTPKNPNPFHFWGSNRNPKPAGPKPTKQGV